MTAMILLRHRLLKETRRGADERQEDRGQMLGALVSYVDSLRFLRAHRGVLYILLANVCFFAYMMLGTNQSLYFALFFTSVSVWTARLSLAGWPACCWPWRSSTPDPPALAVRQPEARTGALIGMALLIFPGRGAWLALPILLLSVQLWHTGGRPGQRPPFIHRVRPAAGCTRDQPASSWRDGGCKLCVRPLTRCQRPVPGLLALALAAAFVWLAGSAREPVREQLEAQRFHCSQPEAWPVFICLQAVWYRATRR